MNEVERFLEWCDTCGHYMVTDLYLNNYLKYLAFRKEVEERGSGELKNDEP